eukprot:TRINITY_DN14939_c2_g1_i1.p1 TRINITY_DN14939_c2_g1~~TRINITY_DN14939_c2_g1_i1.p1  ORF type:complete len:229 (+),score=50.68 TRINITY_DN14939_c2_g1_i1:107-793(+)
MSSMEPAQFIESVKTLEELFANCDREVIVQLLRANGGDVDRTVEILLESQQQQVPQQNSESMQMTQDEELAKALQEQIYMEAVQEEQLMEAYQQGRFGNQQQMVQLGEGGQAQANTSALTEGLQQGVQSVASTVTNWARKFTDALKEGPSDWVDPLHHQYEPEFDTNPSSPNFDMQKQNSNSSDEGRNGAGEEEEQGQGQEVVVNQQAGHMGQLRNRRHGKPGDKKDD